MGRVCSSIAFMGGVLLGVFELDFDFFWLLFCLNATFIFALSTFSCLLSEMKFTLIKLDWAISTLLFRLSSLSTWLMLYDSFNSLVSESFGHLSSTFISQPGYVPSWSSALVHNAEGPQAKGGGGGMASFKTSLWSLHGGDK